MYLKKSAALQKMNAVPRRVRKLFSIFTISGIIRTEFQLHFSF